jgi:hypothetical protein
VLLHSRYLRAVYLIESHEIIGESSEALGLCVGYVRE